MKTPIRQTVTTDIDSVKLKEMIKSGRGTEVINLLDELDVPLINGGTVTVICAYVGDKIARFIFKNCWDMGCMHNTGIRKVGYRDSEGRKHVLEDIYPYIAPDWREIITSRKITETISGEKVEYSDPMWLPSATDLFGSPDGKWWDDEGDSFQLPIFTKDRDRVKEYGEEDTFPYWLRSVDIDTHKYFCYVYGFGRANADVPSVSYGFAPGFDI